ncbi:MAG TPA: amidophosphoribosyltransferase, partial [Porticoccaceae bacterium]|nr:amidophosphoribosyltransferase [Porticoccaceae bacterium]
MASAAPPVRYPNVYGIDMPAANELIAHGRTIDQVAQAIGADWLIYQDIDDLIASAREGNPVVER